MKKILVMALLFSSVNAFACSDFKVANDTWKGQDKIKHFSVSVPLGAIGAYITRDSRNPVLYGALIGSMPGLVKEVIDGCRSGGTGFSSHDMAYNFLGALVGAKLGNYTIGYYKSPTGSDGVAISYSSRF